MRTVRLTKESTKDILENLLKRSPNNYGKFEAAVADILANVKEKGDTALFAFTREFDKVEVTKDTIRVTPEEIEEAYKLVDPSLIDVIKKALVNIRSYHEKQLQNSTFRPFSRRVLPVSTISTITSESPTIGASSMEPFSLMISTV